jgi:competence protein ComEC
LQSALTGARDGYLVTAAVWLFTLPITMSAFHLVSLVGFLINVILIPLSAPLMACGFATLACGLIWKPLAIIPAFGYDLCLRILLILVEESARLRWSHWMVSGPTPVWLFAFYAVLACAVLLPRITARRWAWRALAAVVAIPLALSLRRNSPDGLRCTFVDVGHGGATLIELPNGRTLLFDAGSFGNENRAQRSIEEALRERRISRLDAILISHADSDHYNAAASLLADLPVASLLFPKAFLDFSQPGVVQLCEAAAALSVPQRIVQQGDQFLIDSETTITVLHPQGAVVDPFDNANSLCLRVDYAGRSILLVGDVERGGLASLLSQASPGQMDVLQAPHHGARSANTMDLARWARPKFVVACAADPDVSSRLKAIYRDAEAIFASADSGSVSITISSDGELDVETSLKM